MLAKRLVACWVVVWVVACSGSDEDTLASVGLGADASVDGGDAVEGPALDAALGADSGSRVSDAGDSGWLALDCGKDAFERDGGCLPITACTDSEYETAAPTTNTDRACAPLTECTAGTYMSGAPMATTDRVCSVCPVGTSSVATNASGCYPTGAPMLRAANGVFTGSPHVPLASSVVDHPLKPKLMWLSVMGAADYEVQLDDCGNTPFSSCNFVSPEVDVRTPGQAAPSGNALLYRVATALPISTSVPVGRRYVWRVRACIEAYCGPWSASRYMYVGRLEKDFNGDGYADVAVGAPGGDSGNLASAGRVHIYHGTADGIPTTPSYSLSAPTPVADERYGDQLSALGDVNADGFADLAAGTPSFGTYQGAVYIYYGSASGLPSAPGRTLTGSGQYAYFGDRIQGVGDTNASGYGGLAVSNGAVLIYHGSATGIGSSPSRTLTPTDWPRSIQSSDLNADGHHDVLASSGNCDGDVAALDLFYGASSGIALAPNDTLHPNNDCIDGTANGDLNGDGFPDMAVATSAGVLVFHGTGGAFGATPNLTIAGKDTSGAGMAGDLDVNGDGFADLVVGDGYASNPEASEGNAFVFAGSASGLMNPPGQTLDNPTDLAGGDFGTSVSRAGDTNGDGYADFTVGADYQANGATSEGNAFVFHGAASGPALTPAKTLDSPTNQAWSLFGRTLALLQYGDLNYCGYVRAI
ncbi:MAG: FG-GAP-like repeat-containing protein [Myxococcales bacterium]